MQLATSVSVEEARRYIGGEIVLENNNSGATLTRGTLHTIRMDDQWAQITMTCDGIATGTLENIERAKWQNRVGNVAPVILRSTARIDDQGRLVFDDRSPQGSIAIIKRP